MARMQIWLCAMLSLVWVAGCGARAPRAPMRAESIEAPDAARVYSTDAESAKADAAGSPELAAEVKAELAKRGHKAVADAALMATARWLLSEVNQQHTIGPLSSDAAVRHFGFPGLTVAFVAYDRDHQDAWRDAITGTPKNLLINRFGVCASPAGQTFAVIFGSVELRFEPIARLVDPGATIQLRGEIDAQYTLAHVLLTRPDGSVEKHDMKSRKLDYSTAVTAPGRYKLEVMADGKSGPAVLSNVPIFVGVAEPPLVDKGGGSTSPALAEARMLELLNQARSSARLSPVQADRELRQIALGHSTDMADHGFFSHVSPSTGSVSDRVARSGILVAEQGENIAQSGSGESAHEGLMDSPGHRANMLGASFTHVGIAAVSNDSGLVITMVFARRPDPAKLPRDAAQVEAAFYALRAAKGLPRPAVDPIYRTAAQQGVQAYVKASKPTDDIAAQATADAIVREIGRLRTPRAATQACTVFWELLEVEQLQRNPILLAPGVVKFGLGAQLRTDDKGSRLATVMILEGAPCK